MLVFIDDSGDPGFQVKKGSTPYFVITLVIFDDTLEAEKTSVLIKELRRKLKVSDSYEFRFNKADKRFKKAFFSTVSDSKFRVRSIVVDKQVIYSQKLKNDKETFYNHVIMQALKHSKGSKKNAKLKFDKRGERNLRDQLRVYLSRELNNEKDRIFSDLKFVDSRQNTLIQLADMVAGSIFSKFAGKDEKFLNKLDKSGRIEDVWEFK